MKKSNVILMWGAITGIALVIFFQILKATGQEDSGFKWLNVLIMFLGLFIGTMQFREKANGGYLTFGQGYKTGFLMVLIITLLAVISTIVDLQIHPDFIDKILEQAKTNMINKGMPDDQIEIGMHYTRMFTTPVWIVVWVVIFDLLFGAILSLITAGINVKRKPIFDETDEVTNTETNN
ncbi:MAG TPA: DUF4199 domain-containing protein [Bacteroidia bacterium]|nr:DUF4199 domain-containing protein [Bacteroidia bacterium]